MGAVKRYTNCFEPSNFRPDVWQRIEAVGRRRRIVRGMGISPRFFLQFFDSSLFNSSAFNPRLRQRIWFTREDGPLLVAMRVGVPPAI